MRWFQLSLVVVSNAISRRSGRSSMRTPPRAVAADDRAAVACEFDRLVRIARELGDGAEGAEAPLRLGVRDLAGEKGGDRRRLAHGQVSARPRRDPSARPVPIIESRVTSSASFSSLQPSVPAGRIGSTMKRVSAVESQTRIFVPSGSVDAEIGEHAARIVDRPRAVGRSLVPDRRQAEHLPRIAGAQRADDHVVGLRRVLDRDQVVADPADMAVFRDRRRGIIEQRLLEGGIGPGLGDDAGAVVRADLGLVGLDDAVDGRGVDIALLGQDRFQRPHPQLHLGQFRAVIVVMIMVDDGRGRDGGRMIVIRGRPWEPAVQDVSALCDGPRKRMIQYPPARET